MKKALLIGAVVSSMALSSVAFAAVDYENATAWTKDTDFAYNIETGVLTLVGDKTSGSATTDTTIVVVKGENPTTIDQSNIMYIDQAASAATYGNMGLLIAETPAEGDKATVLFNDGTAAIYTATFDLAEEVVVPPVQTVKFVFGDVDGSYDGSTTMIESVNAADAAAILSLQVNGSVTKGGAYDLGAEVTDVNDTKFVFGDVDGSYDGSTTMIESVNAADAAAILSLQVNGSVTKGGAYDLGAEVSAK